MFSHPSGSRRRHALPHRSIAAVTLLGWVLTSACDGIKRDYGVEDTTLGANGTGSLGTATNPSPPSPTSTAAAPKPSALNEADADAGGSQGPSPSTGEPDASLSAPPSDTGDSDGGTAPVPPDASAEQPMASEAIPEGSSAPAAASSAPAPSSDAVETSASVAPPPATSAAPEPFPIIPTVLVFSKTGAFVHESIEPGVVALRQLAVDNGWVFDVTEDATEFTDAGLAPFNVVVFLNTSGEVLDDDQQAAMERFIQAGHGFVGVHQAAYTELNWAWYGELVGARFSVHASNTQDATVVVETTTHPSTGHLPSTWMHHDEWYAFVENPRSRVHVLLSLDEASYTPGGGAMGDHPIAWHHKYDGGRAFYTGLGHTEESYAEPAFLEHLAGGIEWASGAPGASCGNFLLDRGEACDDGDTSNATADCDATCSLPE